MSGIETILDGIETAVEATVDSTLTNWEVELVLALEEFAERTIYVKPGTETDRHYYVGGTKYHSDISVEMYFAALTTEELTIAIEAVYNEICPRVLTYSLLSFETVEFEIGEGDEQSLHCASVVAHYYYESA